MKLIKAASKVYVIKAGIQLPLLVYFSGQLIELKLLSWDRRGEMALMFAQYREGSRNNPSIVWISLESCCNWLVAEIIPDRVGIDFFRNDAAVDFTMSLKSVKFYL